MLNTTIYFDEFVRYHEMAKWQHINCNLGNTPHEDLPYDDDLLKHIKIYDVVERKHAGFNQLLLDLWYGKSDEHPYVNKLNQFRKGIIDRFDITSTWKEREWLFVFLVHRLTGSGINYALAHSGYHNSCLLSLDTCSTVEEMVEKIKDFEGPKFTSKGYQIAPFPKPKGDYGKGGDYYICEILPDLIDSFIEFIDNELEPSFKDCLLFLQLYNTNLGIRRFNFQFSAFLADIADFMPDKIDTNSHFMLGKNAKEALSYMFTDSKNTANFENMMDLICQKTGMKPYNAEDVACDFIRWIENFVDIRLDYSHIDLDKTWSSHRINDHPFGRQKPMLELGLVDTFNGMNHPHDQKILDDNLMSIEEYQEMVL